MGTSKGYTMPTGGEWTPLKKEATKFAKDEGGKDAQNRPLPTSPEHLLGRYVSILGGAKGLASASRSGTGAGGGGGQIAVRTGRSLGGFLSQVNRAGLIETLKEYDLSHLIGKSAFEVTYGLLEAFAAPAGTLDEQAVRTALLELYDEMLEGADTFEAVDEALTRVINGKV